MMRNTFDKPHAAEIKRHSNRHPDTFETDLCCITGYQEDGDKLVFDFIDDPSYYGFPSTWLAENYCTVSIFDDANNKIGLYVGRQVRK